MFGIGETELLIIVAFGFMIFGPDKLPGMGRTIGRALRQFRQAQEGFTEVVQSEVMDPLQEAMGDPLDTGTRKRHRATAEERAAALAADADIDAEAGETTAHKETFAERKARLAAERKAREAEELAAAQAADAEESGPEASADEEPQEQQEEKPDTSAAALYALGTGRSSFKAAKEKAKEEAAEAEAAAAAEEAVPAADPAPTDAPAPDGTDTTEGKEVGGEQA